MSEECESERKSARDSERVRGGETEKEKVAVPSTLDDTFCRATVTKRSKSIILDSLYTSHPPRTNSLFFAGRFLLGVPEGERVAE